MGMIEQHHVHYCGFSALGVVLGYLLRWWHARRLSGAPPIIDPENKVPPVDAARDVVADVMADVAEGQSEFKEQSEKNRASIDEGARQTDGQILLNDCGDPDCNVHGYPSSQTVIDSNRGPYVAPEPKKKPRKPKKKKRK